MLRIPIWQEPDGSTRKHAPYWVYELLAQWARAEHHAHVDIYHRLQGRERFIAYQAELAHHGSRRDALTCLRGGGCIARTDIFRREYLAELAELAELAGAVPVTPPLCPMGGTHHHKSLKNYADHWRQNNAY